MRTVKLSEARIREILALVDELKARDAVQAVMPETRIVIDKFRVVRMANDAVEKVRKSLRESLAPKQRRG